MNASNVLVWLNFFVADVRDGLGAFLGVFLMQNGFGESQIGLIGTISHIIALVFGIPCGIFVDKTSHKKEFIGFFIALIVIFCSLNYFFPSFYFTLIAQSLSALSGVFLAPAFAALTLGIVGAKAYPLQCARNEAYKHAGTVFGAALSFVFALYFGIVSVFIITAFLGGFALVVLACIKKESIDDKGARGELTRQKSIQIWALFKDAKVLFLCLVMFCFHLSNAHMLPLLSQRAHAQGVDSSGAYAAATVLIAQTTMILTAFLCGRLIHKKNFKLYFWLFFACFFALILRAGVAANFSQIPAMIAVQILDGVGAGVSGVILPVLVVFILRGSGHINAGLALILTCGGLGAALSASAGGYFAEFHSYFSAYLFLGGVSGVGLLLWIFGAKFALKDEFKA